MRGLQLALYARARHHLPATRALYTRYLIFFGTGGALWLSSLAADGALRYAIWAAALLTDAVGALAMLAPCRRVPVNPWHLADRFQIFVLIVLGESVARLISAAADRSWSVPLAVVLAAAVLTLAAVWWAWLSAADRHALDSPQAIARFTAVNLPIVAGIAAASAGLHIAILAAHEGGAIGAGPRAALYGGVSVYLLASAILPSRKLTRRARAGPADDIARRDGAGLHGSHRRPGLPGARPHRSPRPGPDRRSPAPLNRRVLPVRGGLHRLQSERHTRHWPPRPAPNVHRPSSRERIMTAVLAPPPPPIVTPAGPRWDDACQEPTVASVWQAVASNTIGDELLEWPPDLFALTEVILQRSEAYRFALSPPAGSTGHRPTFRTGPMRSSVRPGSGAPGPRTGTGRSLASWPRSGESSGRGLGSRSASWRRHATGESARRC